MKRPSSLSQIVLTGDASSRQRLMAWQAALSLSMHCRNADINIAHICPESHDTELDHGVILEPAVLSILRACGVSEADLLNQCDGAYHCADRFIGWSSEKQDFYHTHDALGVNLNGIEFQHYLTRHRQHNNIALADYSLTAQCAQSERFTLPVDDPRSVLSTLHYRIVVSALKYTELIRRLAMDLGVVELLGKVESVSVATSQLEQYKPNRHGFIDNLVLDSGQSVAADFFIDCGTSLAVQTKNVDDFGQRNLNFVVAADSVIYGTSSKQFRPSLSSVNQALSDCHYRLTNTGSQTCLEVHYNQTQLNAKDALKSVSEHINLDEFDLASPEAITPSLCYTPWSGNCLIIGTPACQIGQTIGDDLNSLVNDLARFYSLFPNAECHKLLSQYYNNKALESYQQLIDWQQLAYKQGSWRKGPFWQQIGANHLSQNLNRICTLFSQTGCFPVYEQHAHTKVQWVSYLLGFELWPKNNDPLLNSADEQQIAHFLSALSGKIKSALTKIPKYQQSGHM